MFILAGLLAILAHSAFAQSDVQTNNLQVDGTVQTNNCISSASPAVCASAWTGVVAVPTGTNPTLVVDTTAVTANSQIIVTPDESLGAALGITCNSTLTTQGPLVITARTAGTSFTVAVDATTATNKVCLSFAIVN